MSKNPNPSTLEYLNRVLPYQKPVTLKRQAEILGVDNTPTAIANCILDTHLNEVLLCIQDGRETTLTKGPSDALVTVSCLIDPSNWAVNLMFPISGPREYVRRQVSTLKITKK